VDTGQRKATAVITGPCDRWPGVYTHAKQAEAACRAVFTGSFFKPCNCYSADHTKVKIAGIKKAPLGLSDGLMAFSERAVRA
jgi:hypothetical protein